MQLHLCSTTVIHLTLVFVCTFDHPPVALGMIHLNVLQKSFGRIKSVMSVEVSLFEAQPTQRVTYLWSASSVRPRMQHWLRHMKVFVLIG